MTGRAPEPAAPGPGPDPAPAPEMISLAERFGALLVVRAGIVASVLLAAVFARREIGLTLAEVLPVTLVYAGIAAVAESLGHVSGGRSVGVRRGMLLVDSAFVAIVMTPGGGPNSQLVFLFYVHLIAVTLLGSHRSGLRIALWDSLLFVLIYTFSLDSAIGRLLGANVDRVRPAGHAVVLSIIAFWVVALCTAVFSWVNERELRRSKEELRSLAAMGAELERCQHPGEIMRAVLDQTTAAFGFSRGAIIALDGERTLTLVTGTDLPAVRESPQVFDAVAHEVWTSRTRKLVRHLDPATDPLLVALLPGAQNLVILPLSAEDEPLGVLAVERGGPAGVRVPLRTVQMLGQFTAHAALSLRNARLLAEVERLARLDALTGLANRRVFEAALLHEARRAQRNGELLSLLVFDVDHFKRVNDTWGHQAGDGVLQRIGEVLRTATRDVDLVARYGGEEFAVLLPTCSVEDALVVAERMRRAISNRDDLGGVTISAGVAALPVNASDGEDLIAAADHALYESKRAGRDRTTLSTRVAGTPSPPPGAGSPAPAAGPSTAR